MKKVWGFFPKFTGTLVKGVPLGWGWGRQHDCVWRPRKMDDWHTVLSLETIAILSKRRRRFGGKGHQGKHTGKENHKEKCS